MALVCKPVLFLLFLPSSRDKLEVSTADDDPAGVSSWGDSVSTHCIVVGDVSRGFHSNVPAVVLRQLGFHASILPICFCSHVPSCSSPRQCVSLTLTISGMCLFFPLFLTSNCDSGFNGAWGPQVPAVGSGASMFSEMSPHPGASNSSPLQFHLDGIRNVSKKPCSSFGSLPKP